MSADGQEAGRGPDLGRKAGALDVDGPALVVLARAAIAQSLGLAHEPVDPHGAGLRQPGACFVTLRRDGRLRGCIGSLEAYRPLGEDVAANARAAAFHDPRFPALHPQELAGTQVEVSVLSTPEPFPVASRADALARMRPGLDGVVVDWAGHRATFLPQVWDQLPEPADFLAHLLRKAGLSGDFWAPDLRLYRYTVTAWEDGEQELP